MKLQQKPFNVTEEVADGFMIVPTDGENVNKVISLNESGGFVWKLIETPKSFDEIVDTLVKEYGISAECAAADLTEFIEIIKDYCIITD